MVWRCSDSQCVQNNVLPRQPYLNAGTAADSGSSYEPPPTLVYEWDPDSSPQPKNLPDPSSLTGLMFELGPHPADPHSTTYPLANDGVGALGDQHVSPNAR